MPRAEPVGVTAAGYHLSLSQGGGEAGSSARFVGFTRRTSLFGAAQTSRDRCAFVSPAALWDLSDKVIAACIEVHRHLGPGLLESAYDAALCEELRSRGIPFRRQCNFPVIYTDKTLDQTHRIDLIAAERLVVEVKAVEALLPVHAAQMLTYLRLTGLECGLLVNFNTELIRHGLRRLSLTPKILASRTSRLPASL